MTAQEAFKSFISSIPRGNRMRTQIEIAQRCDVTPISVYNWASGRAKLRPIYRREINQIAGRDLFETVTD